MKYSHPNHRLQFAAACTAFALACGTGLFVPSTTFAQTTATAPATKPVIARGTLPAPALKTSTAISPSQADQIKKFVKLEAAAMAAGDPNIAISARGKLVSSASVVTGGKVTPATPAYQQVYAAALNEALLPLLKHNDARIRVNAATTLASSAATMDQPALAPSVLAALADKTEPVVMLGVKAAKEVYPSLLGIDKAQSTAIATAVIKALRTYPTSEPMAEDVFETINGQKVVGIAARAGAGLNAMIELLQARADMYAKVAEDALPEEDPAFPANPQLDLGPITYLTITGWKAMTPAQKAATCRAIYDQAEQLVRLAPLIPRRVAGDVHPRREELISNLKRIVSGLIVAGNSGNAAAVSAAAKGLGDLAVNEPATDPLKAKLAELSKSLADASLLGPKPPATDITPQPSATSKAYVGTGVVMPAPGVAPTPVAPRPMPTPRPPIARPAPGGGV